MSDVTEHDAKAGYSTLCRSGSHVTCKTVQARCVCTCHGTRGQEPPEGEPMTEPAPLHAVPAKTEKPGLRCDECGKQFDKAQGLGAHRARSHGYRANGDTPAKLPHDDNLPISKLETGAKPANRERAVPNAFTDDEVSVIAAFLELDAKDVRAVGYFAWFKANAST